MKKPLKDMVPKNYKYKKKARAILRELAGLSVREAEVLLTDCQYFSSKFSLSYKKGQ